MNGRRIALAVAIAGLIATGSAHAQPNLAPGKLTPVGKPAPAPALDLATYDGKRISLAELRGKTVLVNFWATWCEPCIAEMPAMDRLQKELANDGLVVLGVNFGESSARIEQFLAKTPVGFPLLVDPNRDAGKAWKVRILPASFVVGPDGRVRYTAVGEIDWMQPAVVNVLRKMR